MSSPITVSPYTRAHMNDVLTRQVSGFLETKESLVNYACVDHQHKSNLDSHGVPANTLTIPSRLADQFSAQIRQFPRLQNLHVKIDELPNSAYVENGPGVLANGSRHIDHLTFSDDSYWVPGASRLIRMFLDKIPKLKGLALNHVSPDDPLFQPINGERLSDVARANLANLEDLTIAHSNVDAQGLLELLQNSTKFKSVTLNDRPLTNALFNELVRSPELTHLDLKRTSGEVEYGILADHCRNLESFTPGEGITEEALFKIIQSNPNLKQLNLGGCRPEIISNRILEVIGKLPHLEELSFFASQAITDEGLSLLMQGCTELRSLSFGEMNQISPATWSQLKNCPKLTKFHIHSTQLPQEFFSALATKTGLTTLELVNCGGFPSESLRVIHSLVNLRSLEIDALSVIHDDAPEDFAVNDDVVRGIIDHCPKLNYLSISATTDVTEASLNSIRAALLENRTELKKLRCVEVAHMPQDAIEAFSAQFPSLNVVSSWTEN